jgi:U3 small nucleolar RNA-associated protein 10
LQKLEQGLVASPTLDCKVELCNLLLDVGTKDAEIVRIHLRLSLYHLDLIIQYLCCKKLPVALCLGSLSQFAFWLPRGPRPIRAREQANARKYPSACHSKIIDCSNDMCRVPHDAFPRLSLLAEVLASVSFPGSLDLVSRLLETLHNVVQSTTSTDVDISYIEQSIMWAVEHSAERITVRVFIASDKQTIEKFHRRLQILLPVRSALMSSGHTASTRR